MKYKKGDRLRNSTGFGFNLDRDLEIVEVFNKVYLCFSFPNGKTCTYSQEELDREGWELKEEGHWVPEEGEQYWTVDHDGHVYLSRNDGGQTDSFRIATGNAKKTEEEAEKYKLWLLTKPYEKK